MNKPSTRHNKNTANPTEQVASLSLTEGISGDAAGHEVCVLQVLAIGDRVLGPDVHALQIALCTNVHIA